MLFLLHKLPIVGYETEEESEEEDDIRLEKKRSKKAGLLLLLLLFTNFYGQFLFLFHSHI